MGQRLTPAQYEVLAGLDADEQMRMKRQLDTNNEEFLAQRHHARLLEETAEKIRRQKVLQQEWTESESKGKLAAYLEELDENFLSGKDFRQRKRDLAKYMQNVAKNLSSSLKNEKEYHFDEQVGVSLADHINSLKAEYPAARVQTRRDRDGFAIVKVSYKPEFKYDLDTLMA